VADAGESSQQVRRGAQEVLCGGLELRELTTTCPNYQQQGHNITQSCYFLGRGTRSYFNMHVKADGKNVLSLPCETKKQKQKNKAVELEL